jgi:hypothetical protein
MFLNADFPRMPCLVRKEYLYDLSSHHGEFMNAVIFGVCSLHGRALGFHALLANGAMIWRLPISALAHRTDAPHLDHEILQLWDCFSYDLAVTEFAYLEGLRCKVVLKDRKPYEGEYVATIDWCGTAEAEDPGETGHKCGHLIALDNGCFCLQPNNRIQWFEPSFITPPADWPPDYRTNTHVWRCERERKWTTTDEYFYDVIAETTDA